MYKERIQSSRTCLSIKQKRALAIAHTNTNKKKQHKYHTRITIHGHSQGIQSTRSGGGGQALTIITYHCHHLQHHLQLFLHPLPPRCFPQQTIGKTWLRNGGALNARRTWKG